MDEELKIEVKMETRETLGQAHSVYIANCEGVVFEFDPLEKAMNDFNANEITNENRYAIAKKHLEYMRVAQQRASTGAKLRWAKQTMQPEEYIAYINAFYEENINGLIENLINILKGLIK